MSTALFSSPETSRSATWSARKRSRNTDTSRQPHLDHLDLTKQTDEIVPEEITRAEVLLTDISGQSPRPRWRGPFGARNDRVLRIAANLGYRSIYWTNDSLDSVESPKTPQFLIDRITSKTDAESMAQSSWCMSASRARPIPCRRYLTGVSDPRSNDGRRVGPLI